MQESENTLNVEAIAKQLNQLPSLMNQESMLEVSHYWLTQAEPVIMPLLPVFNRSFIADNIGVPIKDFNSVVISLIKFKSAKTFLAQTAGSSLGDELQAAWDLLKPNYTYPMTLKNSIEPKELQDKVSSLIEIFGKKSAFNKVAELFFIDLNAETEHENIPLHYKTTYYSSEPLDKKWWLPGIIVNFINRRKEMNYCGNTPMVAGLLDGERLSAKIGQLAQPLNQKQATPSPEMPAKKPRKYALIFAALVVAYFGFSIIHSIIKKPQVGQQVGHYDSPQITGQRELPEPSIVASDLNERVASGQAAPSMDLVFVMGEKPNKVPANKRLYAFVDPDCPSCQKVENNFELLAKEGFSITLFPVSIHDSSVGKIRAIACANKDDKLSLWRSYFEGKPQKADEFCKTGLDADSRARKFFDDAGLGYTPTLINDAGNLMIGYKDIDTIKGFLAKVDEKRP